MEHVLLKIPWPYLEIDKVTVTMKECDCVIRREGYDATVVYESISIMIHVLCTNYIENLSDVIYGCSNTILQKVDLRGEG